VSETGDQIVISLSQDTYLML